MANCLNTRPQIINFSGALNTLLITERKRCFTVVIERIYDLKTDFVYLSGDLCFENWICVLKTDFAF